MSASSPPENAPPTDPVPLPHGAVPRGEAPSEPHPTPPVATPPVAEPSRGLAALAALLPVLFTMFSCVLFAASGGGVGALGHRIQEMGMVALLAIVASVGTAVVGTTVLLAMSARGWRVPSAIAVGLAAFPWATGLLGAWYGMSIAEQAIRNADASSRATMMAKGISEATNARILGASLASGLLAAVAIGLAVGAWAQRAPGRRPPAGAALGLAVSLPLLAVTAYGLLGTGLTGVILPIAGLGAVLAIVVGAASAGADAPQGRSGALAAAAPVAAGLSIAAAVAAASAGAIVEIFGAMAHADTSSRGALVVAAAAQLRPLEIADLASTILAGVAAAVVAGWAATRARPSPGQMAGAAAVVLTFGVMVGLDSWTTRGGVATLEGLTERPWRDVPDLELVALPDDPHGSDADGLMTPSGLRRPDGSPLSGREASTLTDGLRALGLRGGRAGERDAFDDTPEWLRDGASDDGPPPLRLVLDARLSSLQLRGLFEAAGAYGAPSLILVGERPGSLTAAEREGLGDSLPVLAAFVGGTGSVRAVLGPREGESSQLPPARDPILYHVTVGATPPRTVETRPGARVSEADRELVLEEDYYRGYGREDRTLYVALGPAANARSLMETIAAAESRGFSVVVVPGEIPGGPAEALDLGGGTPGFGETQNASYRLAQVRLGVVDVRGSLSSDVVRRVIRRHTSEVRLCYVQELHASPDLEGRVTVSLIISPTGAAQSAAITSSTLHRATLESCLVTAARRWTFPAPDGGGVVGVNVPFLLSPTP